ncbi:MAG: hypothetical protein ACX932_07370 [Gammaproteobacteria bacterium]
MGINFINEAGFGWVDGEGMLPDLLPLYDEIKTENYQFLRLVAEARIGSLGHDKSHLVQSQTQEAFCKYAGIDHNPWPANETFEPLFELDATKKDNR